MPETFTNKIEHITTAKTVLIVEDSAIQALALIKMLQAEGISVLCAANGQTGVAMAREYRPDLMILDVQMPKMTGLEACRWLKQDAQTSAIPIIVYSAHDEPETRQAALDQGAVAFIAKGGYSEAILLETLRKLNIL